MARILVVDDDRMIRTVFRDILETSGHEVSEAADGRSVVAMHRATPFDLVITDIFMPEKEGLELIMELKAKYPSLKIIAISGGGASAQMDTLGFALNFGADNALVKPISENSLLASVNSCLSS